MKELLLLIIYALAMGCSDSEDQSKALQPVQPVQKVVLDTANHPGTALGELLLLQKNLKQDSSEKNADVYYVLAMLRCFDAVINLSALQLSQGVHAEVAAQASELSRYAEKEIPDLQLLFTEFNSNRKIERKRKEIKIDFATDMESIAHTSSADKQYTKAIVLLNERIVAISKDCISENISDRLRAKANKYIGFFRRRANELKKLRTD